VVRSEEETGMRFWRKRWFLRWTAVAFAASALAAPAAQARTDVPTDGPAVTQQPAANPTPPAATATDAFSWADAGVGAAAALSIVLLAGGSVLVVRESRRSGLAGA
jgi:hypothetical protein